MTNASEVVFSLDTLMTIEHAGFDNEFPKYSVYFKKCVTLPTAGSWLYTLAGLHWGISETTAAVCLEVFSAAGA